MKTTGLLLGILTFILASCSNNGNSAKTGEAQQVAKNDSQTAVTYSSVDASSHLVWRSSHLGGMQKRHGKVWLQSADLQTANSKLVNATVLIDMASLVTENFDDAEQNGKLTGHLKTADFFNVEAYPTAKFELTGIEPATGDFNSTVTGNLTILEVTKSITFKANVLVKDSFVSVESEDFSVDRTNWGLVYNVEGSEGVPVDYLIANDMGFTIKLKIGK